MCPWVWASTHWVVSWMHVKKATPFTCLNSMSALDMRILNHMYVGCLNVLLVEFALEKLQLRTPFVRNMRLFAHRIRCRLKEISTFSHVLTFICSTQLRWERNIGQNNEAIVWFCNWISLFFFFFGEASYIIACTLFYLKSKSWFHKFVQKMPLATPVPWPIWH